MAEQRGRVTTMPPGNGAEAQSDAGALVSQGHAVIRIENETLAQVALQRPRDETKVLAGALKELEMVPEEASKAFYEIPYRDTAPGGEQKMVKVSGPSIRAATALARRWGNCSATARILNEDAEGVDLEGVFIDYESSVRFTRPQRVSKWIKTRRGVVSLDGKRLEAAIGAGGSKAMRNAILTGLPAYLVSSYDKRAREIAGGKAEETLGPQKVAAIVKTFAEFKVDQARLEAYLDGKPAAEWTGSDRASLVGVYNALKDGQTSVEDVFGAPEHVEQQPSGPATATVMPESLAGATVTGENFSDPGADPRPALLAAIAAERARLGYADAAWHALCRDHVETTVLERLDPARLGDFLGWLKEQMGEKGGR